jgi:spoIIIJ-associated protein
VGSWEPVRYDEGNSVTDTDLAGSAGDTDRSSVEGSEVADVPGATEAGELARNDGEPAASAAASEGEVELVASAESVDDSSADSEDDERDERDEDESDEDRDDSEEGDEAGDAPTGRRSRRGGSSLRRLEEEGEVAADYLEELLDITDLDGDIDIDVEHGRASVAVVSEDGTDRELRRLVGARGEVLEALQELSRLAVQAKTGDRSRLMLDIAGFRAARRRALEEVAARACQEVVRAGQPVRMDPMSAFERKVVHDVVADAGLRSESEGEEPGRRVVVFPAGS